MMATSAFRARAAFTLASYNAGPGRVRGLRRQAPDLGYDPDLWFDNVERVALREVGWETVRYVSNIYKYYYAFKLTQHSLDRRRGARDAVRDGG